MWRAAATHDEMHKPSRGADTESPLRSKTRTTGNTHAVQRRTTPRTSASPKRGRLARNSASMAKKEMNRAIAEREERAQRVKRQSDRQLAANFTDITQAVSEKHGLDVPPPVGPRLVPTPVRQQK